MRKLIPLIMVILLCSSLTLVLISSVFALDTTNLISYYGFGSDCSSDEHSTNDGVNNGATNTAGFIGNGCDFEKDETDYIIVDDLASDITGENGFSLCLWVKPESVDAIMMWQISGSGKYCYDNLIGASEIHQNFCYDGSGANAVSGADYTSDLGNWWFTCTVVDTNGVVFMYVNDTKVGVDASPSLNLVNLGSEFNFGSNTANANVWDGFLDEISVWDYNLTPDNISALYNNGNGLAYPLTEGGAGTTPSCTVSINETNPQSINYSWSSTPSGYVWWGLTINSINNSDLYNYTVTVGNKEVSGQSVSDFVEHYFNFNVGTNHYNASGEINVNITNNNASCVYNVSDWTYDFVNPTIDLQQDLIFINNSIHNITEGNTTSLPQLEINFTDGLLDGYIVEIWNLNTSTIVFNYTLEGITTTNYSFLLNSSWDDYTDSFSDFEGNEFLINLTVWDSHNAKIKSVREIDLDYNDDNILVDSEWVLYGEELKFGDKYTYFYLSENKYKIKLTFEETGNYHTFYINSSDIAFIEHSEYLGHIIFRKIKRYLDFEGNNIEDVDITEIDKDVYKVVVELKEASDEVEIEKSYGDLNVVASQQFFTINYIEEESLNTALLTSIDSHLNNIENYMAMFIGDINMLWYTIFTMFFLTLGLWAAMNYNSAFGIPSMLVGMVMLLRYIITYVQGEYWYFGSILVFFMFVGLWAIFNLKSIRNRLVFAKK